MKNSLRIRFCIDFISKRILGFFMEFTILVLGFVTISFAIFMLEAREEFKDKLLKILNADLNNVYIFDVEGIYDEESIINIIDSVRDIEGVKGLFGCSYGGGAPVKELIDLQNSKLDNKESASFEGYYSMPDILDICDVKLESGKKISYEECKTKSEDYWSGVYLGYNYRDSGVDIGNVFYMNTKTYTIPFEVLGILGKDTVLPNNLCFGEYENYQDSWINMNDSFLIIDEYSPDVMIIFNENCDVEEIKGKIIDKYPNVVFKSISTEIIKSEYNSKQIVLVLEKMFYIFMLVSITSIVCIQIVSIIKNLKDYGILLVNGATIKDLIIIELFEMIIKTVLALLVSSVITYIIIYVIFGFGILQVDVMTLKTMLVTKVIWKSLLIILIIVITATIIPIMTLFKLRPNELIRKINYD